MKVWIDADTANEIDDLYAIVRALYAPELELLGLSSTHFRIHDLAPTDSVRASQSINENLVRLTGRVDVPCPMGSNQWMGKAWGGEAPSDSPAVQLLIEAARSMPEGERLILAGQGAQTNIASAVQLAPDIIAKVSVYVMGFRYDAQKGIWNKNEFNIRNDLNAADYLLNHAEIDLHIMPFETCWHLQFPREEAFARLNRKDPVQSYLYERWYTQDPEGPHRIMWDLALIAAIIHPHMATEHTVVAPPENGGRPVNVYTAIDAVAMYDDFWEMLERAPS